MNYSIDKIATEKVGIAKMNRPLIFGDVVAVNEIEKGCFEKGAELRRKEHDFIGFVDQNHFFFKGVSQRINDIVIPKSWGDGEIDNLTTALAAMEANEEFFPSNNLLQEVLDEFSLPGRFEILDMGQKWILDVAHNPSAANNLRQRIDRSNFDADYAMIFSMMKDKQLELYLNAFKDLIHTWIICEMETERSFKVEKIKNEMSKMGIENVYSATSPLDAIKTLEKNASISNNVIVSGSFELVGPIREFLLNSQGRL